MTAAFCVDCRLKLTGQYCSHKAGSAAETTGRPQRCRTTHAVRGVRAGSLERRLQLRTLGAWQAVEAVFGLRLVRAQLACGAHAGKEVVARQARAGRDVREARFVRQRPRRARRAGLRRAVVVVVCGAGLEVRARDCHLVARRRIAEAWARGGCRWT
jgi:hypothetical protein